MRDGLGLFLGGDVKMDWQGLNASWMDGEYCRSFDDVFGGARVRRGARDVAEERVRWAVPLFLADVWR